MGLDVFDLLLGVILIFVYGACFIISIIFTFFLDIYNKLEEKLNFDVVSLPAIATPLETSIDWLNDWLIEHNRIAGPVLILLSALDLSLPFVLRKGFILM